MKVNKGVTFYSHESSFIDNPENIGVGSKIWHYSHIESTAIIGTNCTIGQNVYIGKNVIVGNYVKIQNNVSLYQGVILEDYVFCGPSVVFTNDLWPRSKFPKEPMNYVTTKISEGASLGANSTILCGVKIGTNSMVGAGALVTKDVKSHSLVIGVPAVHYAWVCECGSKLEKLECIRCKKIYIEEEDGLVSL
jgi:UDP-2-acetamido-3-amino-2,3-dideoxy-glucuronate N-acetyltransferase